MIRLIFLCWNIFILVISIEASVNTIMGSDDQDAYVQRARVLYGGVHGYKHMSTLLSSQAIDLQEPLLLPFEADLRRSVIIDSIKFTPKGMFAVAYMLLELGADRDTMIFVGRDIPLNSSDGFSDTSRLYLAKVVDIKIGENSRLNVKPETYVRFSSKGFISIELDAELSFSSFFMAKAAQNGRSEDKAVVSKRFNCTINDWNDWVGEVAINEHVILWDFPNFRIYVDKVYLDHSDLRNPDGFVFPSGFEAFTGNNALWRGLFIKEVQVTLPKNYTRKKEVFEKISFSAYNIIFDHYGLTAIVGNTDLDKFTEEETSAWELSLEKTEFNYDKSLVVEERFMPKIIMPIGKADKNGTDELARFILLRKHKMSLEFIPIRSFHGDFLRLPKYADAKGGRMDAFTFMYRDDKKIYTDLAKAMFVQDMPLRYRPRVAEIKTVVSRRNRSVKLYWDYAEQDVDAFMVYRATGNGKLTFYQMIPAAQREFYDKDLKPGDRYSYAVVARFIDGRMSYISDSYSVKY